MSKNACMPRVSDMKKRLTDAALDLIWHNSYGTTSVDAICERAGAKKGSFYYFFKSKSELTAAALEAEWNKNKANMDALFSPTVPPLERFDRYFDYAIRDAHAQGLIVAPDPEAKARALFACYHGTLAQARIQNDVESTRDFKQVAMDVLGVKHTQAVSL